MAYDEDLAARIRALINDESGVSEKRMFGGVAFLVGGNMAVAASGQGGLMVRVDPAEAETLIDSGDATSMQMRGKAIAGWLRVDSTTVATRDPLELWLERGVARARSLPAKGR